MNALRLNFVKRTANSKPIKSVSDLLNNSNSGGPYYIYTPGNGANGWHYNNNPEVLKRLHFVLDGLWIERMPKDIDPFHLKLGPRIELVPALRPLLGTTRVSGLVSSLNIKEKNEIIQLMYKGSSNSTPLIQIECSPTQVTLRYKKNSSSLLQRVPICPLPKGSFTFDLVVLDQVCHCRIADKTLTVGINYSNYVGRWQLQYGLYAASLYGGKGSYASMVLSELNWEF